MLENLAWELFRMTGDITEYLLYKDAEAAQNTEEQPQNTANEMH